MTLRFIKFYCILICTSNGIIFGSVVYYQQEEMDSTLWDALHYKDTTGTLSLCSGKCQQDPECGAFQFIKDSGQCVMANMNVRCQVVIPASGSQVKFLMPQGQAASGEEFVEFSSPALKSIWKVTASSIWPGYPPQFVLDGNLETAWHDKYGSSSHSWLQVKMHSSFWVKGVKFGIRNIWVIKKKFFEIRVGDTDVTGSSDTEPLCQNQLCGMVGNDVENPLYTDCVAPIQGQYVTFQHYVDTDLVEVSEVDVTVFCDEPVIQEKTMCQAVPVDTCVNRGLKTPTTTSGQKSSWTVKSSSKLSGNYNVDVVIDGVTHGLFNDVLTTFVTSNIGTGDHFPWIQVDLSVSKKVKAVKMHSLANEGRGERLLFTEVRVGDTDASLVTSFGHRICVNAVCKTTGGGTRLPVQNHDCSGGSPLLGQYVTMQRTRFYDIYWSLAMTEVDIEFYE